MRHLAQEREDLLFSFRIQPLGRLIQQHQIAAVQQRTRQS
ncbi:hypothetical protein ACZ87_03443 [Candidatus Erwinia dacicola]|uniref:Uncharacterized protein n=1 Tax=Candidatus Erwinia dacicola TaxID=252393 RepID=A0A328TIB3_9GAMM|nr:hypothetical protein ACZ87_03443 [Candidatus Erwinia dacicola]